MTIRNTVLASILVLASATGASAQLQSGANNTSTNAGRWTNGRTVRTTDVNRSYKSNGVSNSGTATTKLDVFVPEYLGRRGTDVKFSVDGVGQDSAWVPGGLSGYIRTDSFSNSREHFNINDSLRVNEVTHEAFSADSLTNSLDASSFSGFGF